MASLRGPPDQGRAGPDARAHGFALVDLPENHLDAALCRVDRFLEEVPT
ncbi:hypothetical protein [Streptomyces phaeochromogenes]